MEFNNNRKKSENPSISDINLSKQEIGTNTLVSGFLDPSQIKKTIKVNVRRLDDYLLDKKIKNISLIKIDVEGYEYFVLKGLKKYFTENKEKLPPIIVEIIPSMYPLSGIKLADLDNYMKLFSYQSILMMKNLK